MLRLEIMPADYGDCLWLEYGPAKRPHVVLIDGGPAGTYEKAIRPRIARLAASRPTARPKIELVVVTHIDNDHIVGVLDLLNDKSLDVEIGEIWFNGRKQLERSDRLGVKEGLALTKAIAARKIPHNVSFGGGAVRIDDKKPNRAHLLPGKLALTVLSPGDSELEKLLREWKSVVAEIDNKREATKAADLLGENRAPDVEELASKRFKPDDAVANGSSIALLAEYQGKRLLLAADAFAPVVEATLRQMGHSSSNRLPIDAYKLSHHGSRGNNSLSLLELVDCQTYLFSTSGARFKHPHAECVACVLAFGGKQLKIYSNYSRGADVLWNNVPVARKYKHTVISPNNVGEGIVLQLK